MQQDEAYDRVREALVRATETMRGQRDQIAALKRIRERGDNAFELLVAANEQIAALKAELDAWHSVFGTTQLTHAQAKMERQAEEIKRLTERCIELEKWSSEHGLFILDGRTKPLKQEVKGIDYPSDHETVMFIKTETSFKPLKQP